MTGYEPVESSIGQ
ncbi:hypothetical protein PENSTE_c044G04435 [Penicillium steckii]|uniref:Uncharacterized protein n=1 Tax=Penicillium steckii TaxID=303698 RepID=A0A1V6SJU0_9EURO|nr:hypothetical protein PENSTE_c044G04435 [Penicillium steckii]